MGQPTPNDANLTTPPFCSLRVGVEFLGGVASVYVTASSEVGEEGKMVRVERVGDGDVEEEEEEGGSGMCRNCKEEENLHACLQVSCDHQVIHLLVLLVFISCCCHGCRLRWVCPEWMGEGCVCHRGRKVWRRWR